MKCIGDILTRNKTAVMVKDGVTYKQVTIRTNYKGVVLRGTKEGLTIGTKNQFVVSGGQFILSRIDARNGAFGIIPDELEGAIITNDFLAFDINEDEVEREFFNVFLQSPIFLAACIKASRGNTNRKRVNEKFFLNYEINLPPLTEQHRLIQKINKARMHLSVAQHEIAHQEALLGKLKQAILQEAIQGKLTEQWRAEKTLPAPQSGRFFAYVLKCLDGSHYVGHTDNLPRRWMEHKNGQGANWTKQNAPLYVAYWEKFNSRQEAADKEKWLKTGFGRKWIKREEKAGRLRQAGDTEPAAELLKRIQKEKAQLIADKKIRKKKPLPKIATEEIPFDIPDSWEWCRLDDFLNVRSGIAKGGKRYQEPTTSTPYLRVANVQRGHLNLDVIKYLDLPESEVIKYALNEGDLLVTEGGDPDKVGRCTVWRNEIEGCVHQNHIFSMRPYADNSLELEFIPHMLNSPFCRTHFLGSYKQTTNLASINKTVLRSTPIPLPPLAEQAAIVERVEALMAHCRELEQEFDRSRAHAARLLQAVLKEAFSPSTKQGTIR